MPRRACLLALALTATAAHAGDDWPTKFSLADGTEVSGTLNYAWDLNDFSGDDGYGTAATALEDAHTNRRKEFGIVVKKKDVYDFTAVMDFQSKLWLDVALRVETRALFDRDYGRIRVGYFKTPVSMESTAASRASSMLEASAASQAVYEGRRTGVEWSLERPRYGLSAAYFFGQDLQGDNPGTTAAARAIWTPVRRADAVVHLAVSGSVENAHGHRDGRGLWSGPSARFRARPEAGLTAVRLVDSGNLGGVDRIERGGLEALWIAGPRSLQAEYLHATAQREDGLGDYRADGYYVTGSWVLTGETRPYAAGNVGNVKPAHRYGAVETLLRYGELDLDRADGASGGHQHDLTLGLNWYLSTHFKFQANYVRASAQRGALSADPRVLELRAQVNF
ncbi:porin [Lysobacter sp. 5GHs7-4]|uniref:OprO/OprP family phosphate-selective porin n=1 Tax=Lysobacter sp. 5GHs7-4 TaxID=2904253 RepID=UPI001E28A81D|nr:porin [Lysobacter sp. 5GHs7-4]UHQ24405.1 porin [Lysobacter sp. 5GHs7-4]